MKPTCKPYFALLSPFCDGELTPTERMRVEEHLAGCADCAGRVADLRAESGLVRVGMELVADDMDFTGFAQGVLARVTPHRAPFWERVRLSLSERWTYQRLPTAFAGAAAALAVAVLPWALSGRLPEGYASDHVAVQSVTTDEGAHVAPVVMQTDNGDSIIWVVDHAHVQVAGAPDAAVEQKAVDSALAPDQNAVDKPNGGAL